MIFGQSEIHPLFKDTTIFVYWGKNKQQNKTEATNPNLGSV